MLTPVGVVLSTVLVLLATPSALLSLKAGSPPPESGPLAPLRSASRPLRVAEDLFVLTICAGLAFLLAQHAGILSAEAWPRLTLAYHALFMGLLLAVVALWIHAGIKLAGKTGASRKAAIRAALYTATLIIAGAVVARLVFPG